MKITPPHPFTMSQRAEERMRWPDSLMTGKGIKILQQPQQIVVEIARPRTAGIVLDLRRSWSVFRPLKRRPEQEPFHHAQRNRERLCCCRSLAQRHSKRIGKVADHLPNVHLPPSGGVRCTQCSGARPNFHQVRPLAEILHHTNVLFTKKSRARPETDSAMPKRTDPFDNGREKAEPSWRDRLRYSFIKQATRYFIEGWLRRSPRCLRQAWS